MQEAQKWDTWIQLQTLRLTDELWVSKQSREVFDGDDQAPDSREEQSGDGDKCGLQPAKLPKLRD